MHEIAAGVPWARHLSESSRPSGTVSGPKLAILTNIAAPYRLPVYSLLSKRFKVSVFTSGYEADRSTWPHPSSCQQAVSFYESWGFTLKRTIWSSPGHDSRYLHVNPGLLEPLPHPHPSRCPSETLQNVQRSIDRFDLPLYHRYSCPLLSDICPQTVF